MNLTQMNEKNAQKTIELTPLTILPPSLATIPLTASLLTLLSASVLPGPSGLIRATHSSSPPLREASVDWRSLRNHESSAAYVHQMREGWDDGGFRSMS